MFASFRSKTLTILLILLLAVCSFVCAADFTNSSVSIGNYIPMGNSRADSAGAYIVVTKTVLALNANGSSNFHYISTSVGDTSLRYEENAGKNETKAYSREMVAAVITCHKDSTLAMTLTMSQAYGTAGFTMKNNSTYNLPYIMVIVKVSGFGSDHDTYNTTPAHWMDETAPCTYTVVAVLDSRDPARQMATDLTLEEGECFHIVMVPFSNSNTVYWEGANLIFTNSTTTLTATYTARYDNLFTYSYKNSSGTTVTGFATDAMEKDVKILRSATVYETMTFSATPENTSLSLSDMLENSSSTLNRAAVVNMAYAKFTEDANATMPSRTIHISLHPYGSLDQYYFMRSGATTIQANKNFVSYLKVNNITSYSSGGVTLKYYQDGNLTTQTVTNGTTYDTQILGSSIEFELDTVVESISGSSKYKKKNTASLTFDVFPYIESLPSVIGGDYSMIIVSEFTID